MAENKTKATELNVQGFIAGLPDPQRRHDAERLVEIISGLVGEPPRMWGSSIIGFGSYHYKYDSGREGDMARIGFSPRAKETVIYLVEGYAGKEELLARLGKHRIGKSCLYIKKLAEVDQEVLEELMRASLAYMDETYPRAAAAA
jgi:hypothetical protein